MLGAELEGPDCMVNLLKFKTQAEYEDGRFTDLTGLEAYGLCGEQMRRFVESRGGEFLYLGSCVHLMIGSVDVLRDKIAIVENSSKE